MFKKLKIGYKKLHSFLFGEENEHIHTRHERKQYYGRIKTDNESEAKMIHQYPKQGKFRFPIIADDREKGLNKPTSIHKNEPNPKMTRKTETRLQNHKQRTVSFTPQLQTEQQPKVVSVKSEERKKFQGVNFKAREIPSPVYAFKKQPLLVNDRDEKEQSMIENDEKMEIESTSTEIEHCENKEVSTDIGKFELEEDSHEIKHIELKENNYEVIQVDVEEECYEINQLDFKEDCNEVKSFECEVAASVQEEVPLLCKDEDNFNEEKFNEEKFPIQKDELETTANLEEKKLNEDVNFEKETSQKLEQRPHNLNNIKTEEGKRGKVSSDKTVVPFNVLMLQKDRVAHRKSHEQQQKNYQFPTLQLLNIPAKKQEDSHHWLNEKREILEMTLANFNVNAKVVGVTKGPSVTRFEIQPEPGVKVSKVTGLTDDIKLSLAAKDIRIEAPIPGRNAIGIEVPNDVSEPVVIREILRSGEFQKNLSPLTVAMGLDIAGKPIITDIQKMPHGLIAGSTGSGKSVCINSILISIMFKATPDEVKLMLVDPKMVELAPYNDIPHLITPVITDAKQATVALKWAVEEMERRYELFVQNGVRDIKRYNEVMKKDDDPTPAMPYIVIVIDELADLMMVSPQDVEESICRIAQKARACGIHLLVATQRPSVDVITGLIKANIPTRIAFSVSSQADSRTIIDSGGAERLLGKGDMLLFENGASKPVRVQGNFVSDEEIDRVIALVKEQRKPNYLFDKENLVRANEIVDQEDDLFEEACYYVVEQGGASSSSLQRRFRIGFNRAARLIDMMEARGIISEAMGSKPRNVLVSEEELSELI